MDWPLCIVSPPFGLSTFHFHASHPRNPPAFISNGGLNRDDGVMRDVGRGPVCSARGRAGRGVCVCVGGALPSPKSVSPDGAGVPWAGVSSDAPGVGRERQACRPQREDCVCSLPPRVPSLSWACGPWVEARSLHTYPLWPPAPATGTLVRCLRRARACPAVPPPRRSPKVSAAFGVMVVTGSDVGTLKIHLSGSSQ